MINYKRLTVSIDADTLYYLKRRAKKNKRSVSAEADWILSYFLDVDRKKQKEWKNLPPKERQEPIQEEGDEEEVTDEQVKEALARLYGKENL